jgi:MoaA/NifB/PqqE/SkfB family radical SAM enzyme
MYNLSKLGRLHIELTTRCNASCPACSRNICGAFTYPNLEMTELTINDIENFFPKEFAKNISGINYCGNLGDPGIATDLLPILNYFQDNGRRGINQQVRTNGGMRNPSYWKDVGKFFASIPRDVTKNHLFSHPAIVFSVDGLEDTNHIYRRGVKWNKLLANMEAYSSTGAFGIWEFLIFEHNQHQIDEAKKLAEKLGFQFITKNPMGFGEYQGKQTPIYVHNKNGDFEYLIYPANFTGDRVTEVKRNKVVPLVEYTHIVPKLDEFSSNLGKTSCIKCKSVDVSMQEIYVSATGHLLPCCFLGGVFGQFFSSYSRWQFNDKIKAMGIDKIDLRKNTVYDILNNKEFISFFVDGWKKPSVEEGRLLYCVEMCGSISAIDKLYTTKELE